LDYGHILSCGCFKADRAREINTIHGHASKGRHTPEYRAWGQAKERCGNKNNKGYPGYGGRGIKMHEPWLKDFAAFFDHVGPKPSRLHSLDRIDNEQGYKPGNLRWATKSEQINNRRVASQIWPELQRHRRRTLPTLMLLGLLTASHPQAICTS